MQKHPNSIVRRLIAVVALVVGVGVAGASVNSAVASPSHPATQQAAGRMSPQDWVW